VRDALVAGGLTVFAPCLHAAACPALANEGDWCHEDLAVDLPSWLVPVARAAGLRWQRLTFSYAVFRKDGKTLQGALGPLGQLGPSAGRLRVVSDPMPSKGKLEAFLCGDVRADGQAEAVLRPARVRATRLDRDETAENAAWSDLTRGDVLTVAPAPLEAKPRLDRASTVRKSP
jgi:hypothetical protein